MNQSLKLCETRKLHYGKYLYKLVLANSLNTLFRTELQKNGKLSYARYYLDKFTSQIQSGEPITRTVYRTTREIELETFLDAKDVYSILKKHDDYKIRVNPYNSLLIYSNDRSMLVKIANRMRTSAREFWEPNNEIATVLTNNSNIIVVDTKPPFPLKVTFNSNPINKDFATWLEANRDKSKIGDKALENLQLDGYLNGYYMFVRDEKVLNLVSLFIGGNIRTIEKLVYKEDIDKY
jgi:hypothetical protein